MVLLKYSPRVFDVLPKQNKLETINRCVWKSFYCIFEKPALTLKPVFPRHNFILQDQMEMMLVSHVFPEFNSPHGFLRARACWVLHYFSDIKFKNQANLKAALDMVRVRMCEDKDLPVKVEAAIALQMMLSGKKTVKDVLSRMLL